MAAFVGPRRGQTAPSTDGGENRVFAPFVQLAGCCGQPWSTALGHQEHSTQHARNKSAPPLLARTPGRTEQDLGSIYRGQNHARKRVPEGVRRHSHRGAVDPRRCKTSQRRRASAESCQNVGVRLFTCGERRRRVREQHTLHAAEMKLAHEMKECTFFPQTNCACRPVLSKNDENSLSLYERGVRQKLRRQQGEEEGRELKALKELQGCTFHPAINVAPSLSSRALVPCSEFEKTSITRDLSNCNDEHAEAEDVALSVLEMLQGWKGRRLNEQQMSTSQTAPVQPCSMPCQMLQRVPPSSLSGYSLCTYDGLSSGACNKSTHQESIQPFLSSVSNAANQVGYVAPGETTGCSQEPSFSTQRSWPRNAEIHGAAALQYEAAAVQTRSIRKIGAQAAGDAQMVICMLEDWKAAKQAGGQA